MSRTQLAEGTVWMDSEDGWHMGDMQQGMGCIQGGPGHGRGAWDVGNRGNDGEGPGHTTDKGAGMNGWHGMGQMSGEGLRAMHPDEGQWGMRQQGQYDEDRMTE